MTGATTISNTLNVTGATTFDDTLDVSGATTISNTLNVTGDTVLNNTSIGNLDVSGATTISNTLNVTGATTFDDTLNVTGATTFDDTLDVSGATTISNTLNVTGDTVLNNTSIGNLDVSGATTISNTLNVTGATTFDDTLNVTGTTVLNDTLTVNSDVSITGNLDVDTQATFASVNVEDLTQGRVVIVGIDGELQDDSTLTYNGGTLTVTGDVDITGVLDVDTAAVLANLTVEDLTQNRIPLIGAAGLIEDSESFTFDGTTFAVVGSQTLTGNLDVDTQATLASVNVEDLTDNRIVIAGVNGELEDSADLTFDGSTFNVGQGNLTVDVLTGNTQIVGTLDVDSQVTLASATIEDLTDNRIVIAGTSGELEDDANFTFDGTSFNISNTFAVTVASGNVSTTGSLEVGTTANVDGNFSVNTTQFTVDSTNGNTYAAGTLTVDGAVDFNSDLTVDGNIVLGSAATNTLTINADVSSSLIPSATLTYDLGDVSARWNTIYANDVNLTGTITSSGSQNIQGDLDVDGQATLASANVEDLTEDRIVIVGVDGELEDSINLVFDGTELNVGQGNFTVQVGTGDVDIAGDLSVQGDLAVYGTVTTINSTTVTIDDPIFTLGGDTAPTVDDNKDRGIEFRWHDGTNAKVGFFGYDDSAEAFTFIPNATNTAEVFSGAVGNVIFANGNFTNIDVSAQATFASANVEDLTSGRVVLAGTSGELEDSANLTFDGTTLDVTGNLTVSTEATLASAIVSDLTSGRVVLAGTSGAIEDSANLTFDGSILTVTGDEVITGNLNINGNTTLGDTGTDLVTFNALVASDFIPDTNLTYELGSSTYNWNYLHVSKIDSNTEVVTIATTGALTLPIGTTIERPTPTTGMIRFNTDDTRFEAYDGTAWTGVGGVIDVNQDTFIIAESSPGANNDQLDFVTAGVGRLRIDSDGDFLFGTGSNNFTIDWDTANTTISGTLLVGDAVTFNNTLSVAGAINGASLVTGDFVTVGGLLTVTGNSNFNGTITSNTINATDINTSGNIAITGTLDVNGQTTLSSANVEDLTDNRIVIAGVNGELEDDANFRFDGTDLLIGAESSETFTVNAATGNTQIVGTLDVDGQATLASVNVEDLTTGRIVIVGANGELEDDSNFTFDGTTFNVTADSNLTGSVNVVGDLDVDNINIDGNAITSTNTDGNITITPNGAGEVIISTATVSDLTDNRIVIAGTNGSLEDNANFTFNGTTFNVGATSEFTVDVATGNTQIVGTLDVNSQSTLASANVEDLTSGRVVLAGVNGELEDSANLTFDGTDLTTSSLIISDLTDNRVLIAGTAGAVEDSGNLTFDGTLLNVIGNETISGTLYVGGQASFASANVEDLTSGRVVLAGTSGELEDNADLVFTGTEFDIGQGNFTVNVSNGNVSAAGSLTIGGDLTVNGTTTTVNSTTVTIDDPVFTLGGDTAPTVDDNKDRGIEFRWHDGTNAKVGFFGYDDSAEAFTFIPNATNTAEVFSGAVGNVIFANGNFTNIDVSAQATFASANVEDLTSGRVVLAGTSGELEDSANLTFDGTTLDVTGNLTVSTEATLASAIVSDLTSGRVVLAGTSGAIEDSANLTFDGSILTVTGDEVITGNLNINGNTTLGDTGTDLVTFNALVASDFIPDTNLTYELGSSTYNWNYLHVSKIDSNTEVVTIATTGALTLPIGTTIERPTPTTGMIRFNTDDTRFEAYDGTAWTGVGGVIDVNQDTFIIAESSPGANNDQLDFVTAGVGRLRIDSDGDFLFGTGSNNFTIDWDTANTTISGTLLVGDAVTFNNTLSVAGAINGASLVTGDFVTVGGLLTVTGNSNFNGTITSNTINATDINTSGNIAITGTLDVNGQTTLSSANVEDLTDNRIVIAGVNGELEDDANFRFDGTDLLIGAESSETFTVNAATGNTQIVGTLDVDGQATLASVNVEDLTTGRIVIVGANGELEDDSNFTFDGTTFNVTADSNLTGSVNVVGDLDVDNINIDGNAITSTNTDGNITITPNGAGEVIISTATVSDLTDNRIVIAGTNGSLEDNANFTFNGTTFNVGATSEFTVDVATGNTQIVGTLDVNSQSTLASANVEDLTSGRVVLAGVNGELEDSANLTFDGTDLTTSSLIISDLTDNRVLIAGTAGAVEDSGNLTFDGTLLNVIGNETISGTLYVGGQASFASANVEDLTSGRVVLAGTSGELEDNADLVFTGTEFDIGQGNFTVNVSNGNVSAAGSLTIGGDLTVNGTTTTVNSTTVTIDDPVFTLGGDTAPTVDDNKDRGIEFRWHNGSSAKVGFFGYDDSIGKFTFIPDATNTAEVFSGAVGDAVFNDLDLGSATINAIQIGVSAANEIDTTAGNLVLDSAGGTVSVDDNLTVSGETTLASAVVSDLTDNRIVIAGTSGALEDSSNLTFDGISLSIGIGNFTVAQASGNVYAAGTLETDGEATLASAIIEDLTAGRVVLAGTGGAIEDSANLTFDGTLLTVTGNTEITGTLDVNSQGTIASLNVEDLTDNRIVIAGTSGELEDDGNFTFDGTTFNIGATGEFTVAVASGNTQVKGTIDVDGEATLASAIIEDLTDNRVLIAGVGGAVEDDVNFTFDGTTLTLVADADITGSLDIDNINIDGNAITSTDTDGNITLTPNGAGEVVASTLTVSDLTSQRVVLAGTSGSLEDSANLTFNGSALSVTGTASISSNATVGGTLDVNGQATFASANVEDLTNDTIVIAGLSGELESDSNFRFNGTDFDIGAAGSETFTVNVATGNTQITGSLSASSTIVSDLTVSSLTNNRILIAGTSGAVEDDANLTFDGTTFNVGSNNFTVTTVGNTNVGGTLTVTNETNIASVTGSTSTSSGALVVGGGAGIGENLYIGGSVSIVGTLGTDGGVTLGDDASSDVLTLNARITGDLTPTANDSFDIGSSLLAWKDLYLSESITFSGLSSENEIVIPTNLADALSITDSSGDLIVFDTSTGSRTVTIDPDVELSNNLTIGATTPVDSILDEDDMISDSDTALATQQSIKAYVDNSVANVDLNFDGDTGSGTVNVTTQSFVLSGTANEIETSASGQTITIGLPNDVTIGNNLTVTNNLIVSGDAVTFNTSTVKIEDPIVTVGGTTPPSSNDNKDKGIEFVWHDGTSPQTGFFGYDISAEAFTFVPLATNSSEVITGSAGNVVFGEGSFTGITVGNIQVGVTDDNTIDTTAGNLVLDSADGTVEITDALSVTGEATLSSATISDLTDNRIVIAGPSGSLEDDANFRYDGTALEIGPNGSEKFVVTTATGNTAIAGTLTVTGTATHSNNSVFGTDGTDTATFNARIASNLTPSANDTRDLGASGLAWRDLYLSESVTFVGGSSDNEIIVPNNLADALSIKDSVGDIIVLRTTTGTRLVTITPNVKLDGTFTINGGVSVNNILDEDTLVSDSATALATQQSIKAYVDNENAAQDLDFAGDTGTGSVLIDSETFTIAGTANEIVTSASGQTITVGLPDDVTITNDLSVGNDVIITGNLTVNGTTTTVNTTELVVTDNIITLNEGEVGAGVTAGSAGIEIDRGSESTVSLLWDEVNDRWTVGAQDIEASEFYGTIDGGTF